MGSDFGGPDRSCGWDRNGSFLAAVSFLNILLTKVYFLYIVYLYNKYS